MKKIFLLAAALFAGAMTVSAQDMAAATETAKMANESLMAGNDQMALSGFQEALVQATACGEAGAELVATCKGIIPKIMLSIGKDLVKAGKFDEAVVQFGKTAETAKKYEVADVVTDANEMISDTYMRKATALSKAGDIEGAIASFTKVQEAQPTNGMVALQLGNLYMKSGKTAEAVAAFELAKANGQEKTALKMLSNLFLKDAQALLKAGKFKEAIAATEKSNEYLENANAYKLAANASTKLKDNAKAIGYYEKYLAIDPDAKDANGIICTLAVLYQQAGNKEKAIENYSKIVDDPKFGVTAKQQLEALKK